MAGPLGAFRPQSLEQRANVVAPLTHHLNNFSLDFPMLVYTIAGMIKSVSWNNKYVFWAAAIPVRMSRGQTDRRFVTEYIAQSRKDLIWEIASQAWSWGIPWAEALPVACKAVEKGNPKPKAWPKAKSRPKAKAKSRA